MGFASLLGVKPTIFFVVTHATNPIDTLLIGEGMAVLSETRRTDLHSHRQHPRVETLAKPDAGSSSLSLTINSIRSTMVYDTNSLYPIVHDLTDAEYDSSASFSMGCGCAEGLCFSLQDLLVPSEEPRALVTPPAAPVTPRRKRSLQLQMASPGGSVDSCSASDASVESVYKLRTTRFQDAYVLTRQVRQDYCRSVQYVTPFSHQFSQIYQGDYCMVWESIHRQSGQRYATKVVDRRTLTPGEDIAVVKEVATLEQLGHEPVGTISCIDFYQESTHYYIVTEYAQGGSLQSRLAQGKSLDEEDVKRLARSLLEGLQYLDSLDMVHRNLRPENILLYTPSFEGDEESTLIADFGTATHIPYFEGVRGKLVGKCGSSLYAAPEVQNKLEYDSQADMWSLGVVLFQALSGSLPFIDKSKRSLLRKITRAEFIFDPRDWQHVSKSARRFISGLLRAKPYERMTAQQALKHSWLSPPEPCVAIEAPIGSPLHAHYRKRVQFVDTPMAPKRKLGRVLGILRVRKKVQQSSVGSNDDNVSCSSRTMSSSSTDPIQGGVHLNAP